ncbi:YbjQ family protein [Spirillospora sp. CA-294931]|uniref:YbjQ family protein n=1 Tax=Spirillospora sp. CA-294931 TaxID=3240042 RepID=UPI003D910DBB
MLIVTTDGLAGYEIRNVLGEAMGVAVQADQGRPAGGTSSGTFRVTGENPGTVGLAAARRQAVERLGEEARRKGANAVVGMCFDTAALGGGHEVCAYGTAVWAEPAQSAGRGDQQVHPAAAAPHHPNPQVPPYDPQPGGPPMAARNLTIGVHDRPR